MQRIAPSPSPSNGDLHRGHFGRKLTYFLFAPILTFVIVSLALAFVVANYQNKHRDRIYTGVTVAGVALGGLTQAEAEAQLAQATVDLQAETIRFTDPTIAQGWQKSPAALGVSYDVPQMVEAAFVIGRRGGPVTRLQEMFNSWYYGVTLPTTIIVDEAKLDKALVEFADVINKPALNAALSFDGETAVYTPSRTGQQLDTAHIRAKLTPQLGVLRQADVELLVHETLPAIYDSRADAAELQQVLGNPFTFYLAEPLDETDLAAVTLPVDTLRQWVRVELVTAADGTATHRLLVDENAVRHWLSQFEDDLYREPTRARFYFDDDSRELVVVAPHINGRSLNIEETAVRFLEQVRTPNRSIPFVVNDIVPEVHAGATAADLGITELITQTTTWFYGSSDARKHNIARAAANFFGIVIAPGEEFSFNQYLGSISQTDGYEEGLIIIGGRTIKGIGGGVCQVSTTVYQAAFLGGFPITSRYPHGYMLGYYNDGQGPGMDATVFSPIVDIQFINNTPYHLLMENYYNETNEALTVKFYSTSLGRQVVKSEPVFENIQPAPTDDVWEYDPTLEPGTVRQIDWATIGADVTVQRTVYNANGDILINEDVVSNYIPYANTFLYGPGVEPYDYSLVPDDPYD